MDKKNLFISWSGTSSHRAALVLKEWLPTIIQTLNPFISSEDIEKGVPWFTEIGSQLDQINCGILCITRDNINAPWILFEAGALSKRLGQSRVVPLLIGVSNSDLKGPLAQLNTASIDEADIRKLLKAINSYLGDQGITESQLEKSFQLCWPQLQTQLDDVLKSSDEPQQKIPTRPQEDILEEILQLTRTIVQTLPKSRKPQATAKSERVIDMELVRNIRDVILQMWGETKRIESSDIFDRLIESGVLIPDYAMKEALGYLRQIGCISGPRYVDRDGIKQHGSMSITSVDTEYLSSVGG